MCNISWSAARLDEFEATLSMYGTTFTFNGKSFQCIADVQDVVKQMQQTNYTMQLPATISMRQSDFTASGINERSTVVCQGYTLEVYGIHNDSVDPIVDLKANYKQ